MTTGSLPAVAGRVGRFSHEGLAAVAFAAGCVALASRTPGSFYMAITIAVGVAGALYPLASDRGRALVGDRWLVLASVVLGVAAFAVARALLPASLLPPPAFRLLALTVAAAVAEEAFFRRLGYATLERWGAGAAIVVSSVAFAFVHVPLWGWRAFPVDLGAGVLFGWQRWATGSWTVPAATHATANVLMML